MSVYKPDKSRYWAYDFQYKGRRFHGSTGVEGRRTAEAVERKLRQDAALGRIGDATALTLDQAAGLWWAEVGQHLRTAIDVERRLATVLRLLGPGTPIAELSTRKIARAIERRRGETYAKSPAKDARRYPISNATVNLELVTDLRRVLVRARKAHEAQVQEIDWNAVRLPEPPPAIRFYTEAEQVAWMAACDDTARLALRLMLTYGMRFGELFFRPDAVDAAARLTLNDRKAGPLVLPLRADDGRPLAARAGRALAAGLETVWFEEVPGKARQPAKLRALTYYGLQARLRSAAKRAGIKVSRVIHGARHHAGTAMLRRTGNLKLTQRLLGHASITSTLRYAHALESDLLAALEAESRNSPGGPEAAAEIPPPDQLPKRA